LNRALPLLAAAITAALLSLTACSSSPQVPSDNAASHATTAVAPATPPAEPEANGTDRLLCSDLATAGQEFYFGTYRPIMVEGDGGQVSMEVDAYTVAAQVGQLTSIGGTGTGNGMGGADTISQASAEISENFSQMTGNAKSFESAVRNAGSYGGTNPNMTDLLTSFTGVLVACAHENIAPSWFDAESLVN
jgi:hypothetical protein